ncbi:MAG: DNA-3-methyladenine glycosylase family protein [Planctomycetaceae bacterium]
MSWVGAGMGWNGADVARGTRHLRRVDPILRRVIDRVGPCTLKPHRNRFEMLVWSIVSQQISSKAARSIKERVLARVAPRRVVTEVLAGVGDAELRQLGISPQKLRAIRDLTERALRKEPCLASLHRYEDAEVIERLVQVRGIGVWTAQMFLMFSLGRPDVLPWGDFGIRTAMQRLYELSALPDRGECERVAAVWRPHATLASWYCWRSLE